MSVTVSDLLSLPSLQKAEVLAGKGGLKKVVTSVTVLEYANITEVRDYIIDNIKFLGGELVITGFASVINDVEAQLENIKALAAGGEVGIVLYYVGILLPQIDPRLIKLCDDLDFTLICMPKDPSLQYSELITESMDLIVRDQMNSTSFALDILEQVSRMPEQQQTVETLISLISNRIRASVAVFDHNGNMLSTSGWPRNQEIDWDGWIEQAKLVSGEGNHFIDHNNETIQFFRGILHRNMSLLIFKSGNPSKLNNLDTALCKQAVEGLRLGMNLWGKDHDKIGRQELLNAIMHDEPVRMRRLAAVYNIDVASLNEMWIIHPIAGDDISSKITEIRELSEDYLDICICEGFEENIIILPVGVTLFASVNRWISEVKEHFNKNNIQVSLTRSTCLQSTADVKNAYWGHSQYIQDVQIVFPEKNFLTQQDIAFVKGCREKAESGEQFIKDHLFLLKQLLVGRDKKEILSTLQIFLLDTGCSVIETAVRSFVHQNTIKYRLKKCTDILGYRIGEMPASLTLMEAVALVRLLKIEISHI